MSSERPAKRVRQACEPCRRKKSRCPGEKPICSHCSRLRQNCFYADDRHERGSTSTSPTPQPHLPSAVPRTDPRLDDRLKFVESQLAEVLVNQASLSRSVSRQVSHSPANILHQVTPRPISRSSATTLPQWDVVVAAAENYLMFCDGQPLPLFHRSTFMQKLQEREIEVLFSILALSSRFRPDRPFQAGDAKLVRDWVEAARAIISKKTFDGHVELSTIQSLCLISLIDFTDGHTRRASVYTSLAMTLAHNAGLTSEASMILSDHEKEERRRCFWSLFLLKRLHGADFMILDFAADENFPWYPATPCDPLSLGQSRDESDTTVSTGENSSDRGIMAYAIQLSEVWLNITRSAWRRGKPTQTNLPPWSSQSDYSTILAQQMDFETRMPYIHRFKPANFSQRPVEELNAHRDYWGPWLLIQFLYHTNLCLLNHPLLLSLRLRNFKGVIPELFLQHTSDLISSHTSWIINFIDMLEAKGFKATDPFLGHCVAIVSTIYLQGSVVDDPGTRKEKQDNFHKCLGFIRGLGVQWPHVARIADKLQGLSETVSSTHVASEISTRQNRKLLIDLGQFFEVLEYASSSEIPDSARQLFGPSLHSKFPASRTEMAQTSVLPEPTRVERQEFGNSTPAVTVVENPGVGVGVEDLNMGAVGGVPPLIYSDDELAVLAESFFHQRQEFDGSVNWWNLDNLGGG